MPSILGANTLSGGYQVENSLRFNSGSSDRLNKTLGTPTNNLKFTYSFWIKRSKLGEEVAVTEAINNSQNKALILFRNDDQLEILDLQSDSYVMQKKTNRKFRDTNAWYHIVFSNDSTAGSPDLKLYVNGVEETSWATDNEYSQNEASLFNSALANHIGASAASRFINCYFSEFVFIDGQALAATSFGEFDEDSPTIWKPKDVSDLTFGDNGFYFEFKGSGTDTDANGMGADTSGNTNHFAVNNLTSIDQTVDTCTNNFTTWNAIADNLDVTLSEGNTKVVHGTALERRPVISSFGVSAGKWYWEWEAAGSPTAANMEVGIVTSSLPSEIGRYLGQSLQNSADFTTYVGDGNINMSGSTSDSGTAYAGGDIIGVAVDIDNTLIYFYKNNTLVNSGGTNFSGMTFNGGNTEIYMSNADRSGSASYTASVNFGNPNADNAPSSSASDANGYGNFEYAPPSGFYSLCTKNIAEFG